MWTSSRFVLSETPMTAFLTLRGMLTAVALGALAACATQHVPTSLGEAWGIQVQKLPDWSGLWFIEGGLSFPGPAQTIAGKDPAQGEGFSYGELPGTYFTGAPYTPKYQRIYDARVRLARDEFKVYDPMSSCIVPHGMPRIIGGGPGPTEFLITPEQTTIIWDYMNEMRRIYTDGRPHPSATDFRPTVMGHSIGRWEGDTLVVDTRFMKSGMYDRSGAPHSDQVHVQERIHLINDQTLEFQVTIEDPVMLSKPWRVTRTYRKITAMPGGGPMFEVEGTYCEQDRNPVSKDGQTATLPGDPKK
jgi:hypothetical protein